MNHKESTLKITQANLMYNQELEIAKRYQLFSQENIVVNADIITLQELNEIDLMINLLKDSHPYYAINKYSVNPWSPFNSRTAVFSKQILNEVNLCDSIARFVTCVKTSVAGQTINVFSIHGPWGATNILERLEVFERVDKTARELELEDNSLSIIGGDLNAFDDSREYRFLTGRDIGTENQGAYWIDAWSTAGTNDNYATCSPRDNYYARLTAQRSGLKEYMRIPDRRIDYILTRGWNHGKRGDILDFEMQDKYNVYSDHWTLNTTIQI